jgi:hypothetical protein
VGVCFSGLDKVPLGFVKERITRQSWAAEAHTEEAPTMVMVIPRGFVTLITLCAKEKWLSVARGVTDGRESLTKCGEVHGNGSGSSSGCRLGVLGGEGESLNFMD